MTTDLARDRAHTSKAYAPDQIRYILRTPEVEFKNGVRPMVDWKSNAVRVTLPNWCFKHPCKPAIFTFDLAAGSVEIICEKRPTLRLWAIPIFCLLAKLDLHRRRKLEKDQKA